MDSGVSSGTTRVKRLSIGARVSGSFGDWIPSSGPGKRRTKRRIFGTVLEAVGEKEYKVLFDNQQTIVCYSNSLKLETASSLPPDLLRDSDIQRDTEVEDEEAAVPIDDGNEVEDAHLPHHNPEHDEMSEDAPDEEDTPPEDVGGAHPLPIGHHPVLPPEVRIPTYHERKAEALRKIREMNGMTTAVRSKNESLTWEVTLSHEPDDFLRPECDSGVGYRDISSILSVEPDLRLGKLFLEMLFKDMNEVHEKVAKMNSKIKEDRGTKTKDFSVMEFITCIALLLGAAEYDQQGNKLFRCEVEDEDDDDILCSFVPTPDFGRFMPYHRFKDFRRFLPTIWCSDERESRDVWWRFCEAIDTMNQIRSSKLQVAKWLVVDESMSAWRPRTTALGGLPNISFISRKPEPLGTEFKVTACPITGCLSSLEIQRGKDGTNDLEYNNETGKTAGVMLRLLKLTSRVQTSSVQGVKGDAWFGSVRNALALKSKGYECILQIKQNHWLFPKQFVESALKDAPGGVQIVLKTRYRNQTLIALGYRYSRKTTLLFVMTDKAGTTKTGDPYKMKYTDIYGNLCERAVDRPDVISNYFADSNIIDTHNHLRQSVLGLEKRWLCKDAYFRLTTTLIGMTLTDTFLLAKHHKLIDSKKSCEEKRMGVRRFAGIVATQLLKIASSFGCADEAPVCVVSTSDSDEKTDVVSDISRVSSCLSSAKCTIASLRTLKDANGGEHNLVKYPINEKSKKRCSVTRRCKMCIEENIRHDVIYYCFDCGEHQAYCSIDRFNTQRDCFEKHVRMIKKILPERKRKRIDGIFQ